MTFDNKSIRSYNSPAITTSNHSYSSNSLIPSQQSTPVVPHISLYAYKQLFKDKDKKHNRIHSSITNCKRNRKNRKKYESTPFYDKKYLYKCDEYWCSDCSKDESDALIKTTLTFTQTLSRPAFATIILRFIKSPAPNAWKRDITKAIHLINLPGIFYPEIAFKKDKVMAIADKGYGYDKDHQYLLHLHGIIDLKDRIKIKSKFDKPYQIKIEEIGIGNYAWKSWERNIADIVKYSTKKNYLKSDRLIIEMNPNGFGYHITKNID